MLRQLHMPSLGVLDYFQHYLESNHKATYNIVHSYADLWPKLVQGTSPKQTLGYFGTQFPNRHQGHDMCQSISHWNYLPLKQRKKLIIFTKFDLGLAFMSEIFMYVVLYLQNERPSFYLNQRLCTQDQVQHGLPNFFSTIYPVN